MKPETIEELFQAALSLTPVERADFLARADPALRAEVESLLRAADAGNSLLDGSPLSSVAPPPALKSGDQLGSFSIIGLLGRGGMGEVYRARDLRLKREVALKVLPTAFASDHDRAARFEREARSASALNHPNIVSVYDIGRENGRSWIVSELVVGDTLARVLERGPFPAHKLMDVAAQIADGLAAAHAAGVVHRDLKPGNIMLTRDWRVKILDFGLARQVRAQGEQNTLTDVSHTGLILGTPRYMSPEQARGEPVDARSDIFSFGVVLFEMAAGKPATYGEWLNRIVRRCLELDPDLRFQSAADLAFALNKAPDLQIRWRPTLAWVAVVVLCLVAASTARFVHFGEVQSEIPNVRFTVFPPQGMRFGGVRYSGPPLISPDGSMLAFGATSGGKGQIWIQRMNALAAQPLAGTDRAVYPFWSPDSRYIAFFDNEKLMRVPVDGGLPEAVITTAGCCGGTWGQETILVNERGIDGIARIPAAGGAPVQVTAVDREHGEIGHVSPQFLPDGRHFLFLAIHAMEDGVILCVGDTRAKSDPKNVLQLMPVTSRVWWAPPGYLLFLRDDNLVARAFDAANLKLTGVPFLVAAGVESGFNRWSSDFSVSNTGVLAWRQGFDGRRQLAYVDRSGKQVEGLDIREPTFAPRLSPDGRRIALIRPRTAGPAGVFNPTPGAHLWSWDLARASMFPLTVGNVRDATPIWSPNGRRIVFGRRAGQDFGLYSKDATGAGDEELLLKTPQRAFPSSWSPDGSFLVFAQEIADHNWYSWLLPLRGERKAIPLGIECILSVSGETQFSPDGKWIAYSSAKTGHMEVYVGRFNPSAAKIISDERQISTSVGQSPHWRSDGKEIFYRTATFQLSAVPIRTSPVFAAGAPVKLFDTHDCDPANFAYDVSPDGQRFLLSRVYDDETRPINISLNWLAGLKK